MLMHGYSSVSGRQCNLPGYNREPVGQSSHIGYEEGSYARIGDVNARTTGFRVSCQRYKRLVTGQHPVMNHTLTRSRKTSMVPDFRVRKSAEFPVDHVIRRNGRGPRRKCGEKLPRKHAGLMAASSKFQTTWLVGEWV
ncbi:uncharacterized protein LOC143174273 [Nomia melanderi]|uniref:uncharacterized protein LOC143174273 n=1 Tax=Nomia melanderi TaxID=2448451 RepID=UPI003FCEA851